MSNSFSGINAISAMSINRIAPRLLVSCILGFLLQPGWSQGGVPDPPALSGTIDGAAFEIHVPHDWDGKLAIYNRGFVPESNPVTVYIPIKNEPFPELLDTGWMVAASSYRRNGLIIEDALEDVRRLLQRVELEFRTPDSILLIGSSMGGAISLLLMERNPDLFDGALILGRGLEVREPESPLPFNHRPGGPVLFMTNNSEVDAPRAYVEQLFGKNPRAPGGLWIVEREGHVRFSQGEMREAIRALIHASTGRSIARNKTFLIPPVEPPSQARFHPGAVALDTYVADWSPTYGNLDIMVTPSDLKRLGLESGNRFFLKTPGGSFPVLLGNSYRDVPEGHWVAFTNEFGRLQVAINRGHAANTADTRPGDPLTLTLEDPSDP